MYKSKSKSKSNSKWGEYSEWAWEENQQFWYRVRQDAKGNLDYDYDTTGQASLPRSGDIVEDLSQRVEQLSTQDYQDQQYQVSGGSSSQGKSKSSKSSSKGKGRRTEYDHDDDDLDEIYQRQRQPIAEEEPAYAYGPAAQDPYYTEYPSYQQGSSSSRVGGYALRDDPAYSTATTAGHSFDYDPGFQVPEPAFAYDPRDTGGDDGRSTPKPSGSSRMAHETRITANFSEALDPRYRVEKSDRFQPGEIFKAGWAEPKGSANDKITGLSGKEEIKDTRGVTFITGFRRFIVVANDLGHSTCVPILTYGGRACTKSGVKPQKHGIIYQRGQRPKLLDREPKLGFPPVKVDMTMEGEKLSKESRVNYSKLITVEHNVKVMFIGTITTSDWPLVPDAINRCWNEKEHNQKRHHK